MVLELHCFLMIGFWLQKSASKIEDKGMAVVFIKSRTNTDRRRQKPSGWLWCKNFICSLRCNIREHEWNVWINACCELNVWLGLMKIDTVMLAPKNGCFQKMECLPVTMILMNSRFLCNNGDFEFFEWMACV